MPATKKRSTGRRSEPKLFRCTGFGDCDMVFTRSEHLARHARKHTGEKPFKCVVPNCNRMFSRFDNMMQHTHTHNRNKRKEHGEENKSPSSRSSSASVASTPNTPITEQKMYMDHHRILPRSDNYYSYKHHEDYHNQYYNMPPPPPPPPPQQQQQHWTPVYYPVVIQPPSIYTLPQQPQTSVVSPTMTTDDFSNTKQRKIELSTPINQLDDTYSTVDIQITPDEFEALQGFGKFCTKPIIREPIIMSRITTSPKRSVSLSHPCSAQALMSNHVLQHSKVNAFRHYVNPTHESSIRLSN